MICQGKHQQTTAKPSLQTVLFPAEPCAVAAVRGVRGGCGARWLRRHSRCVCEGAGDAEPWPRRWSRCRGEVGVGGAGAGLGVVAGSPRGCTHGPRSARSPRSPSY